MLPLRLSPALRLSLPALLSLSLLSSAASTAAQQAEQSPGIRDATGLRPHAAQWEGVLAAEDARTTLAEGLAVLRAGLRSSAPEMRIMAVRALGRFERLELAGDIVPLLRDDSPRVRAHAANALAQALVRGDAEQRRTAREALLLSLSTDAQDAVATAVIAESVGRLRHESAADARITVQRLLPLLSTSARQGSLRGLYFLARQQGMRSAFADDAIEALRAVATTADDAGDATAERNRTLAVATLAATGGIDAGTLRTVMRDVSPFVRREAIAASAALTDSVAGRDLVSRGLGDGSGVVRYEALRQYSRRFSTGDGCGPVRAAAGDPHLHTALLAIDLLASCRDDGDDSDLLASAAADLPADPAASWHRAAHALVSLAAVAPPRAVAALPSFATHDNHFVRTYAARAATRAGDTDGLRRLASDAHGNARTAAVQGLRSTVGRAADDLYIAQLARDESELLQAAAAALDGTDRDDAVVALLDALDRVTAQRRETSRDARRALLTRARQLGSSLNGGIYAPRLIAYVADFDPEIAELAADIMGEWTGARPEPAPELLPPQPLPSFGEAAELAAARVVIVMADGGDIEIRLLPFEAPTNAARFARLARAGYFDGLTFHRVVPNFVVQGGSPGASEYTGDGPFTRDELGLARNWRGSVGLSTRGRDTGDAQIYINTIDNVRLDHDYTIFAEVVRGMDVVDRLAEGAVIRRVEIRSQPL
ncbi:hypothetical protein BH23GEM9_BH23GEM9_06740 [soil metagenome]